MYVTFGSQVLPVTNKLGKVGEIIKFIFSFLCRYLVTFSSLSDNPEDPQVLQHFGFVFFVTPVLLHLNLACSVQLVSGESRFLMHTATKSCQLYLVSRETL